MPYERNTPLMVALNCKENEQRQTYLQSPHVAGYRLKCMQNKWVLINYLRRTFQRNLL